MKALLKISYLGTAYCGYQVQPNGVSIQQRLNEAAKAVFGFDCAEICTMMNPPLPVVRQPEEEIGRIAAQYMIDRLGGFTGESRHTRLKCKVLG